MRKSITTKTAIFVFILYTITKKKSKKKEKINNLNQFKIFTNHDDEMNKQTKQYKIIFLWCKFLCLSQINFHRKKRPPKKKKFI